MPSSGPLLRVIKALLFFFCERVDLKAMRFANFAGEGVECKKSLTVALLPSHEGGLIFKLR